MKQLRLFFSLLLVVVTGLSAFAQDNNEVTDSAFYFIHSLPPRCVNPLAQPITFTANKGQPFGFGIAPGYRYIVVKLQVDKPAPYILCINNTSLDTVFIYSLSANGKKQLYCGGNAVRYDVGRPCVWHTASLMVNQQPSYYLVAVKAASQNININYQLLQPGVFQRRYHLLDTMVYSYTGFILLISLICLTGGIVFKRKALLIYTGYVLSLAGWILAHYGYLFPELYPSFPILNIIIKQVTTLVAMLCLLNLITVSFKAELKLQEIRKAFPVLKVVTAMQIVFYLAHLTGLVGYPIPLFVNILWNVSLMVSVGFILIALSSLFRTSNTARLFSAGISIVSLMAVFQSVSNVGWLYNYFLNEHGMMIASVLEMLILTFGIFYNLWQEKTEKEKELQVAEGERSKTLQMLIGVQEDERKRIAGDLHDSIGPMLAAIKINFLRLAKAKAENRGLENLVEKTESIIDESIAEIRAISHRLMPKGLSSKGLITLLTDYFTDLETVHHIRINFTHDINVALDKEVQLNLYRMMSELSLNAAKHSGAEWLCVSIKTFSTETLVEVKDDGAGFIKGVSNSSSLGLKNVQSRVDYLKGTMQIVSAPGTGTTVSISIPHGKNL